MSVDRLAKIRAILEAMVREEQLPERARRAIAGLGSSTTPEELGMDSLARLTFAGRIAREFGSKVDLRTISGARDLEELLRALPSGSAGKR